MSAIKRILLGMAALLALGAGAARAAEVIGNPVCRQCCPQTSCYPVAVTAYRVDPCCERVGPVRRLLRRVFRPCCPPPARVAMPVPVVVPVAPPCPPTAWTPPVSVLLDRPTPIPPAPPGSFPPPGGVPSSLRNGGVLTPPTPPPPIRLDRIASREGITGESVVRAKIDSKNVVTLVQVGKPDTRQQVEVDSSGRIQVDLTPGTWVLYVKDAAGKSVEQGRLMIRERRMVRMQVRES